MATRGGRCRHFPGARFRRGASPDHHQIQPRRGQRHAEGQGRAPFQGARREIHQRQGEGRSLSELVALQRQGRDRSIATRLGADAGAFTAKFAPLGVKEFEALDLPWLFKDDATDAKAMKGPIGQWLFKKLEAKGITGLAFWDNGFHMVSANGPLLMPADFQGLKIRISGSKIADRYFRDMGAIPQIMAFSEVYQALQTGVVDGCENTPSNYLTQKFHEVQKDITVSNHAHLQYAVIVNTKFWNGLPADIRAELTKAMDEATDYTNSIARKENEDALAAIKASGKTTLHYLTDDQRKAWQTAMRPTYTWAKGRVGQEVLDLIGKELDIKMN